ncbi:MAG: thioredoxin family protein [Chitinophagaceae bacterium]|nr:thioredoxin family protein [Chitinophagaceae bacterium]
MKKKLFAAAIALCISFIAFAQHTTYEVLTERPNEKTFKGFITKDIIAADSFCMKWYGANYKAYSPDPAAKEALSKNKDSVQLLIFMGTWCEDSQFIIPRLFALADATGFSYDRITMIGVDRNKKTFSHLTDALNVTNVPTIIVMKKGKEAGRVVEYGKTGMFDKDLATILNSL